MGRIQKIKDTYYIEFYARGLLYSQLAGTDLKQAQIMLEQIEAKIAQGESLTVVRDVDWDDFILLFEQFAAGEYSPVTCRRFKAALVHFTQFIQSRLPQVKKLSQITPHVIEVYQAHYIKKKSKPKLINFTLLLIRDVLEYGIRLGYIHDNPAMHVRLLPLPVKKTVPSARYEQARHLLGRHVPIGKTIRLLGLKDIGKIMYFSNLIPLSRTDMYNQEHA